MFFHCNNNDIPGWLLVAIALVAIGCFTWLIVLIVSFTWHGFVVAGQIFGRGDGYGSGGILPNLLLSPLAAVLAFVLAMAAAYVAFLPNAPSWLRFCASIIVCIFLATNGFIRRVDDATTYPDESIFLLGPNDNYVVTAHQQIATFFESVMAIPNWPVIALAGKFTWWAFEGIGGGVVVWALSEWRSRRRERILERELAHEREARRRAERLLARVPARSDLERLEDWGRVVARDVLPPPRSRFDVRSETDYLRGVPPRPSIFR